MRLEQLLDSIADHSLINKLVKLKQECQRLEQKFDDLVPKYGYETARKITLDRIPDFSNFLWHIQFASRANPNIKKSYDNLINCIENLRAKLDSGL